MLKGRSSWRLWLTATLLLSTLLFPVCSKYKPPAIVPVGEVRIVGTFHAGVLSFLPGESPTGEYFIVTRALIVRLADVLAENRDLRLKLEKATAKK